MSRVAADSPYGAASLNLTSIREADQGWYECKVVFLNRSPNQHKNGTWFHLDVHAPPRFSITPEDIIYVNLGERSARYLLLQPVGRPPTVSLFEYFDSGRRIRPHFAAGSDTRRYWTAIWHNNKATTTSCN